MDSELAIRRYPKGWRGVDFLNHQVAVYQFGQHIAYLIALWYGWGLRKVGLQPSRSV